jgi:hypothetical protein
MKPPVYIGVGPQAAICIVTHTFYRENGDWSIENLNKIERFCKHLRFVTGPE